MFRYGEISSFGESGKFVKYNDVNNILIVIVKSRMFLLENIYRIFWLEKFNLINKKCLMFRKYNMLKIILFCWWK